MSSTTVCQSPGRRVLSHTLRCSILVQAEGPTVAKCATGASVGTPKGRAAMYLGSGRYCKVHVHHHGGCVSAIYRW
eukprot:4960774-Amphidinium_carterae.3